MDLQYFGHLVLWTFSTVDLLELTQFLLGRQKLLQDRRSRFTQQKKDFFLDLDIIRLLDFPRSDLRRKDGQISRPA